MKDGKNRKKGSLLWTVVFLFAVTAVCVALYNVSVMRSRLRSSIDRLRNERVSLAAQKTEFDQRVRSEEQVKRRILSVVQMCRDADDIPAFGGNRLIRQQTGQGDLFLHVPEGDFSLLIKTSWSVEANVDDADKEPESVIDPGSREWRVPLQSSAGYHFELKGYSFDVEPVAWSLTCNQPGFDRLSESLDLPPFEIGAGSSWGTDGKVVFPNEVSLSDCRRLLASGQRPETPSVFRSSKVGKVGHQKLTVMFEVSIETSAPYVLPARQLSRFDSLLKQKSQLKYIGDGHYQVIPGSTENVE